MNQPTVPPTFTVTTSAELAAAFAAAKDGGRIELASGEYAGVKLYGRDFPKGLTITSADPDNPAVFTDLVEIRKVSGLTLQGIDLQQQHIVTHSHGTSHLTLREVSNVNVLDMNLTGYLPTIEDGAKDPDDPTVQRYELIADRGRGIGIRVMDSKDVHIEHVKIADVAVATRFESSTNVDFIKSEITGTRDGVTFAGVDKLLIENNYIHDLKPFQPVLGGSYDHPDMIQFWGVHETRDLLDVKIRDNVLYQPADAIPTQAIFGHMRNAPDGVRAADFEISGNLIISSHYHGISVGDVDGFLLQDNLVINSTPNPNPSWMYPQITLDGSTNGTLSSNVSIALPNGEMLGLSAAELASANIQVEDHLLLSRDAGAPNYWGKVLQAVTGDLQQFTSADLNAVATTQAILDGDTSAGGDLQLDMPVVLEGTDGREFLRHHDEDSLIYGYGGSDWLFATFRSQDILVGGTGADAFHFDFRRDTDGPVRDAIVDLNFDEGDSLVLMAGTRVFRDDLDRGNELVLERGGERARIDSLADLREAEASGAISLGVGRNGSILVTVNNDSTSHELELISLQYGDL